MYLQLFVLVQAVSVVLSVHAKMAVTLHNFGFHRSLEYTTVFSMLDDGIKFCIEQELPAAVYVSTDQLDDMKRFSKLNYYVDKLIDIEKPTEKSEPFKIYFYGNTSTRDLIVVPIHFRYHAPSNKTSFVKIVIDPPTLFIELDEDDVEILPRQVHKIKCMNSEDLCEWELIDYDNYTKKQITAHIPVGNANLTLMITVCTIAISWTVSICTIIALFNKKDAIKNKLK